MKREVGKIAAVCIVLLLTTGAARWAQAQAPTFTILHSFSGSDGANPEATLLVDATGNLYGTTQQGGSFNLGTVFKLDPAGNETVLHNFSGPDGASPAAGLVTDAAGNFYGTTAGGGSFGVGTVFKLDPGGNETVLHSFRGTDGAFPVASLVRDAAGNLYGTTAGGGSGSCTFDGGCGTVFRIDSSGDETVLYNFNGSDDATHPEASLIIDATGNLYGTTSVGGAFGQAGCSSAQLCGFGTVFKLNSSGQETLLHSFGGSGDGAEPFGPLIVDSAGNLYGTTALGGLFAGTVFKLDPSGNETVLHNFTGPDGASPFTGLVMDAAGNLYGTTSGFGNQIPCNGPGGCGNVFKLDASGTETVLHSFTNPNGDGGDPRGGLTMDSAGNLYGTTLSGGTSTNCPAIPGSAFVGGCGTVFKISVQTPQQATQAIINSVNALFSQGVLNAGQNNSLVVQLQHAISMMNTGKNNGAIGNLDSFISEVNDLLSSGVLSAAQAASLTSAAQSVIAAI